MTEVALPPGCRVLEIGVGTGVTLPDYPRDCRVTGVDLSPAMLARARKKVERGGLENVTLLELDAQRLPEYFEPDSFDVVVAAFVLSVVPDPAVVLRGMRHVGTDDCRYIIINHLQSPHRPVRVLEKLVTPLTRRLGWRLDFELSEPLAAAGLEITRTRRMRRGDLWRIVDARKAPSEPVDGGSTDADRASAIAAPASP